MTLNMIASVFLGDVGVNMENDKLVKMFNPTLKMRETNLFFLIAVINGLI